VHGRVYAAELLIRSADDEREDQLTSPSGKTPVKEAGKMKTICAVTIVASVMYILLILLRFT
jgi:hypothetical protein